MKYIKLIGIAFVTITDVAKTLLHLRFRGTKGFFNITRKWSGKVLKILGVSVEIRGAEHINPNETYVYVMNHTSLLDIPVIQNAFPDDVLFVYKKELEKVPVFGTGLKASPYISIDRSDPRNSMAAIDTAVESIRQGDSVIIFPEGTRSEDGKLGEFKRGAFMLASRSGRKIVPLVITGANKCVPNKKLDLKPGKVRVDIFEPIDFEIKNKADEVALMEKVRVIISKGLEDAKQPVV